MFCECKVFFPVANLDWALIVESLTRQASFNREIKGVAVAVVSVAFAVVVVAAPASVIVVGNL